MEGIRRLKKSISHSQGQPERLRLRLLRSMFKQKLKITQSDSTDDAGSLQSASMSSLESSSTVDTLAKKHQDRLDNDINTHNMREEAGGGHQQTEAQHENPVQRVQSVEPVDWTIEDVIYHITRTNPALKQHADLFRKHEIDGKALLLLNIDNLIENMGLKLGPALKIENIIENIRAMERVQPVDPAEWTIEDVYQYIAKTDPALKQYADLFRKEYIDGKALLLLNSDILMNNMGLKLLPALKICDMIKDIRAIKRLRYSREEVRIRISKYRNLKKILECKQIVSKT